MQEALMVFSCINSYTAAYCAFDADYIRLTNSTGCCELEPGLFRVRAHGVCTFSARSEREACDWHSE